MVNIKPRTYDPGELERCLRAGLLLLRFITPWSGTGIIPTRHTTQQGIAYDLYEPDSSPRRTFIMVYGLTLAGERDARLVKFARAFAVSGFKVAIPDLPGLKTFQVDAEDITAIAELVCTLLTAHGGKIGITAFSVGAGLALTATAQRSVRDLIDPLLLFGPYYSLVDLWARLLELARHPPVTNEEWDDYIYIRLALAYRNLGSLDFDEGDKRELIDLLGNYCWEPSLDRKRRAYERLLRGRDILEMQHHPLGQQVMQTLSPCGKLGDVTARVLILHDRDDPVVPPHHSERLYEELCARNIDGGVQQLLITSLLSHVNRRLSRAPSDLFRILRIIGEIFR